MLLAPLRGCRAAVFFGCGARRADVDEFADFTGFVAFVGFVAFAGGAALSGRTDAVEAWADALL